MLKKLMITTASLALLTSAAIAQAPDQTQPAPSAATTAKGQVITEQKPDQLLASKFKGTDVIGSNNEKIGDVNARSCVVIGTLGSILTLKYAAS